MTAVSATQSSWLAVQIRRLSSFSLIGGLVTLVSTTSNIVLLKYFNTPLILTYVCVYCAAITLSYLLNSIYTFRSGLSIRKMLLYFCVYLSAMGLGVVLLKIFRALLPFENWVLPLLVLPFTAMWNFSLSSVFMLRRRG
jgi:putative flippase GtrA